MTDFNPEAVQDGLDHYPVAFLQHLIDNGEGWKQQGELPRAIERSLEDGTCVLGRVSHHDYFNNVIPARSEVEPGAKGSLEYANRLRAERGDPLLVETEDGAVVESGGAGGKF
ncbi:MAG: hypothetical protein MUQ32_03805 [Chloroflexi bacterium]|nr:hypothetical protein [Chloroflexota bacterium]